ncbi:hypothetical protein BDV96DRAFT_670658 [Lophiotrema nucula]|uniref:Uncharacterized protein n=1 Tax=Lophiotrema nucula TaxID=690887 RepID=A0A6A5YRH8_9PLEO|nr:hypothetical protein BDV96DRAFT_670658 [Lophiotrema nucula]
MSRKGQSLSCAANSPHLGGTFCRVDTRTFIPLRPRKLSPDTLSFQDTKMATTNPGGGTSLSKPDGSSQPAPASSTEMPHRPVSGAKSPAQSSSDITPQPPPSTGSTEDAEASELEASSNSSAKASGSEASEDNKGRLLALYDRVKVANAQQAACEHKSANLGRARKHLQIDQEEWEEQKAICQNSFTREWFRENLREIIDENSESSEYELFNLLVQRQLAVAKRDKRTYDGYAAATVKAAAAHNKVEEEYRDLSERREWDRATRSVLDAKEFYDSLIQKPKAIDALDAESPCINQANASSGGSGSQTEDLH